MDLTTSQLAHRIRAACVDAAIETYEDAGIRGVCLEGRWEAAIAAVRGIDVDRLVHDVETEETARAAGA